MKKILVVDDDMDTLNVVKLVLAHHRYLVKTTWKWQILVRTIRTFTPDLIMLDIDLDGADGSEICKKLKKSTETKHVPVILISVHNMNDEYLKECDAQAFLNKPFELAVLLETVRTNLN